MSSYIDSFFKGVPTRSISYSREKMHSSQNLITGVVKKVFQYQGCVILEWKRLHMVTLVHWTHVESEDEKKKQEQLKTKFEGLCKVIKNVPGPIGVDKPELVKPLTAQLFADEHFLIPIDMYDEYMEQHYVVHFIGAPPYYIYCKKSRQFIKVVRQRPYNVVLFD
ncbi:hypothetical protein QQ045_018672 [Rhodiola kirilowii]